MPEETTTPAPVQSPAPPAPAPASPPPPAAASPAPADVDPEVPPTPAGWSDKAWRQYYTGRREVASATAALKTATADMEVLKAQHAREIAEIKRGAERETAWTRVAVDGSPLAHPDVRRVVERSYDDSTAGKSDAPTFADWLKSEAPKSPVLAPYFASIAAPAPTSSPPPAAAAPLTRTDAHAAPHTPTTTTYTPEQRRQMRSAKAWTPQHEAAYLADLSRKAGVKF